GEDAQARGLGGEISDGGHLLLALAARSLGKLAAVAVGIARMNVDRLDHVVADAGVVVTDRLALDRKARHVRRRPERRGHRDIEPDFYAISSIPLWRPSR